MASYTSYFLLKTTLSITTTTKTTVIPLSHPFQLNHIADSLNSELKELGQGPPDDIAELRVYLLGQVQRFVEHLRSASLGNLASYVQ